MSLTGRIFQVTLKRLGLGISNGLFSGNAMQKGLRVDDPRVTNGDDPDVFYPGHPMMQIIFSV
ncbi:hypothetical protein PEC302110_04760 [Pectobacterium araliae]|uniref:Uncharacterized protein n=1 Tax=Pectobacterium araliae TaxID=3073862 RepID=A0AAN0KEI3_9GAMM|nr:hypothetical protein PEC302110_04760 [Pectobacterium sp. MAFF 302110]